MNTALTTTDIEIRSHIHHLPGRPPFMLAHEIAEVYEVRPKDVSQAIKRNPARFPEDFAFRLTAEEVESLRPQSVAAKPSKSRVLPLVVTQEGCNQLSSVLKSPVAAARSVQINRAFAALERGELAQAHAVASQPVAEPLQLLADGRRQGLAAALDLVFVAEAAGAELEVLALVARCRKQGLTQREAGRAAGISRDHVQKMEARLREMGVAFPHVSERQRRKELMGWFLGLIAGQEGTPSAAEPAHYRVEFEGEEARFNWHAYDVMLAAFKERGERGARAREAVATAMSQQSKTDPKFARLTPCRTQG
ncbi:MAG: ORF6N domain-containing protein [Thermodesulfobacteriota bacterium]